VAEQGMCRVDKMCSEPRAEASRLEMGKSLGEYLGGMYFWGC